MDCREFQDLIPVYLAGQIDDISRKKMQDHLGRCSKCSVSLDQEQALNSLLDGFDMDIPEIDISNRVMNAIEPCRSSKVIKSKPFSLLQDLLAAAAAAIIVFSGLNAAAADMKVPDYGSAINTISGRIGNVTSNYVKVSSDAVNIVFTTIEEIRIFPKGDELE